jgi:hypothetical protein
MTGRGRQGGRMGGDGMSSFEKREEKKRKRKRILLLFSRENGATVGGIQAFCTVSSKLA